MALTAVPRRLIQTLLDASMVPRFTNTTGQKQVIKELIFCNRSSAKGTFSLAVVPLGETLSDKHYIFDHVDLFMYETKIFSEFSTTLELDDDIYVSSTISTSMYITAAEFIEIV